MALGDYTKNEVKSGNLIFRLFVNPKNAKNPERKVFGHFCHSIKTLSGQPNFLVFGQIARCREWNTIHRNDFVLY